MPAIDGNVQAMLEDLVGNLDRAWAVLNKQPHVDLVMNLYRFHEQLERDTRTAALLEDLRCEEADSVERLNCAHAEVAQALREVTDRLEAEAPTAFDAPPDAPYEYDSSIGGVRRLISQAERVVADPYTVGKERTDSDELSTAIAILLEVCRRADRLDVARQLATVKRQLDHAHRARSIFHRTSAASSLVMIERHLRDLHPPPHEESQEAELARMARVKRTPLGVISDAIFGVGEIAEGNREIDTLIDGIRLDIERVYEDVRRRIGAERSLLAVFQRYRYRCQWYDADRLRKIADGEPGKAEDRLTETLATYLFDHGLNPLIQPLTGKIRPDLLDAHARFSFYVEAKQYKEADPAYMLKGMQQVWDMLDQLRASAFDVREAFFVVYRRGGPRYDFPDRVQHKDRVVHVLMIDIAPPAERGSRAPNTVTFTREQLLPKPATDGA